MKQIVFLWLVVALLCATSCTSKFNPALAQQKISEAEAEVSEASVLVQKMASRFDSVQNVKYRTEADKDSAINVAEENVAKAKSIFEHARQKFEAAKQAYKDATDTDYVDTLYQVVECDNTEPE